MDKLNENKQKIDTTYKIETLLPECWHFVPYDIYVRYKWF